MAVATRESRPTDPLELAHRWRTRINQAKEHRKPFEKTWLSNLAFAAGQHWLVWDNRRSQLRHIQEIDSRYAETDLYVADRITEYRQAQLGELSTDDDRPELLAAKSGDTAEEIELELNQAVAHGWDHEWKSDDALAEVRRLCYDMGVAAIRCRFDNTKGPQAGHVTIGQDGQPVTDQEALGHLEEHGMLPDGSLPNFKQVREGRTVWEPLSAFNLLTPAGVNREWNFPWEVIVRPTPVDVVQAAYPHLALTEDNDIANVIGMSTGQQPTRGAEKGRLRDHVWLYTCFERPCPKYPNGTKVVLVGNQFELCEEAQELDYQDCDGEYRTGLHYFHWWRLNDRFHSRAGIEPLKDPQRLINRRETQNAEIIDRGMPKVFVTEGSIPNNPQGLPLEVVPMKPDAKAPDYHQGIGPGPWMYQDLEHHVENLAHASTLSPLRLGENPQSVDTYSQLALLNENEALKRSEMIAGHKRVIGDLVEDSVYDIRRYWPEEKQILVAGDDERISAATFRKSQVPDFYMVKTAKGAPKPRSQGAELKKIEAIWSAAVQAGIVQDPRWVQWYSESLDAGQAQELPHIEIESTIRLAHFENFLMEHGEDVAPADYDPPSAHLPIHRAAQDQARAGDDVELFQRIQRHIEATLQVQALNALKLRQMAQSPSPLGPTAAPLQPGQPQVPQMGAPVV